jgi:hypothetical protein
MRKFRASALVANARAGPGVVRAALEHQRASGVACQKLSTEEAMARNRSDAKKSSTGREESRPGPAGETAHHPAGGQARSQITGRHDAGSGANETIDGLNSTEESLRKGAEETPIGSADKPLEDVPVFDRGKLPPKV